jgi:hypothetical protein
VRGTTPSARSTDRLWLSRQGMGAQLDVIPGRETLSTDPRGIACRERSRCSGLYRPRHLDRVNSGGGLGPTMRGVSDQTCYATGIWLDGLSVLQISTTVSHPSDQLPR